MKKKSTSQLFVGTSSNNNSHMNDNNDNIITIICHIVVTDLTLYVETECCENLEFVFRAC